MTNPVGRPSSYTEELGLEICSRIASGESLRRICKDDKMPSMSTVLLWVIDGNHNEFSEQYAKAREIQAELLADEIFDISDDGSNDWVDKENNSGESYAVLNPEAVSRRS